MNLNHLRWLVVRPALKLLEDISGRPQMAMGNAEQLLLSIALQESGARHRFQIVRRDDGTTRRGPACSYWQFEKYGGLAGVMRHSSTGAYALRFLEELDIAPTIDAAWEAFPFNDLLAAGFARLLLWTDPAPIPAVVHRDEQFRYYLRNWRPRGWQQMDGGSKEYARWLLAYKAAAELLDNMA